MYEIIQSDTFYQWLSKLEDNQSRMRILARLDRVLLGNFGDVAPIGEGLSELRVHCGPGYRLYFIRIKMKVVMLCGGDKSSQSRDIEKAKKIAQEWRD
jgi:putative addiction module killer protein